MDGVTCGHGWHFGGSCVPCEHEWEQVWIEPQTLQLAGPFRCRKCRIVRPESEDAVDPIATNPGKPTTRDKESD